jgi:hypothetical protein
LLVHHEEKKRQFIKKEKERKEENVKEREYSGYNTTQHNAVIMTAVSNQELFYPYFPLFLKLVIVEDKGVAIAACLTSIGLS